MRLNGNLKKRIRVECEPYTKMVKHYRFNWDWDKDSDKPMSWCEHVEETFTHYNIDTYYTYEYRKDPVIGVGRGRGRGGYSHRRLKSTNERRLSLACDQSLVRCRRNFNNLPDTWDDYTRSDWNNNNWKDNKGKYRKQWMRRIYREVCDYVN